MPENASETPAIEEGVKQPAPETSAETIQEIEAIEVVAQAPKKKKKPKASLITDNDVNEIYHQYLTEKEQGKTADLLVSAVSKSPESVSVADALMKEMAEEAFVLKFAREQEEKNGGTYTAKISHQRLQGLRAFAEVYFKRNELFNTKGIDLNSEQFKAVYELLLMKIAKTFTDVGLDNYKPVFFHQLQTNLNGWEAEAELAMAKVAHAAKKESEKKAE